MARSKARSFKLGRKPPKNHAALRLGDILTGVVPAHPASEDYLARLTGWQMLGNNTYGDCVAVTWANVRRLVTATLATETYPDIEQVLTLYRTQNPAFPAQDDGMDIQTCLEYLATTGGPDGVRAIAFAKVDMSDREQVKAALSIFGYLWTGITVLSANFGQFDRGQPWDYVVGSPKAGGHSVASGGYLGDVANDVRFITWGQETGFTDPYWDHEVEEAWVVIWPEHLGTTAFAEGVDLSALGNAYKSLTGRDLPVPGPTPGPTPAPPPDLGSWLRSILVTILTRIIGFFKRR